MLELEQQHQGLDLVATPLWLYDSTCSCNVWGNRAALELFGVDSAGFRAPQLEKLSGLTPQQLQVWKSLNALLHKDVEVRAAASSFARSSPCTN